MKEFHYWVQRDGIHEAVEEMKWVFLQEGIELEHNVLGCSYCQVVDGQFQYCSQSVQHPCHILHDILV